MQIAAAASRNKATRTNQNIVGKVDVFFGRAARQRHTTSCGNGNARKIVDVQRRKLNNKSVNN
jgi:hypothetical protein